MSSCSGTVFAVDEETGSVRWTYDTSQDGSPAQFHADPVTTSGLLIVASDVRPQGYLYAFDLSSGLVRWKVAMDGGVAAKVLLDGDRVLVLELAGKVTEVALQTGRVLWRTPGPEGVRGTFSGDAALNAGRLFVPWGPGWIDSIDSETGRLLWRRRVHAVLNTSIALFDGEVLVGTMDGRILRLAPETGKLFGPFDPAPSGGAFFGSSRASGPLFTRSRGCCNGARADRTDITVLALLPQTVVGKSSLEVLLGGAALDAQAIVGPRRGDRGLQRQGPRTRHLEWRRTRTLDAPRHAQRTRSLQGSPPGWDSRRKALRVALGMPPRDCRQKWQRVHSTAAFPP